MQDLREYAETPLMKQYNSIKAKHPDAILLFRVGDFYETFGEDAIRASEILGITLTRRANGSAQFVELAGFPYHALDTYLPRLVRAGQRVAICEPPYSFELYICEQADLLSTRITCGFSIINKKPRNNYIHIAGVLIIIILLLLFMGFFNYFLSGP
jgi:DNA mismatch repair ATPase MutS